MRNKEKQVHIALLFILLGVYGTAFSQAGDAPASVAALQEPARPFSRQAGGGNAGAGGTGRSHDARETR